MKKDMSEIEKISIERRWLHESAEVARLCSKDAIKERIVVSQAVALAVRESLRQVANLDTNPGRSSDVKYVEILDICDFQHHKWTIEVRVITNVRELALYVPTMPLMVGVFSDFYLLTAVNAELTEAQIFGFATREMLAKAELTSNGMFAVVPLSELKPFSELIEELQQEKNEDSEQEERLANWGDRAARVVKGLNSILHQEDIFTPTQIERLTNLLREEIWRDLNNNLQIIEIAPLLDKLFERFDIDDPVLANPNSKMAFRASFAERERFDKAERRRKFFTGKPSVERRVTLYRYLLENDEAADEHRRLSRTFNQLTGGTFQTSKARQSAIRTYQKKSKEIFVEPPLQQPKSEENPSSSSPIKRELDKIGGNEIMSVEQLKQGAIIRGILLPEPVQISAAVPMGDAVKILGKGLKTNQFYEPVFSLEQLKSLEIFTENNSFDGDAARFRIGVEALRLGLAYEYDPYFALSIARVDPLPHQLEAVYDYFLKMPCIRFLLADDPGAGKTIMAGLLLKELKIRGLAKRILIVTPANLTFQWQREMKDKFRENFEIVRGDVLRANYGSNPWQDKNQVITSVSWVSTVDDAKQSLLRSHWDLIIVDEAHKMSAYSSDKKTLAYQLGENLSKMTDHYLLMTATPHKGDPKNFCLFLELLDKEVYGNVKSLEEAMRRKSAPFYLRRTKESLVTFPDSETGVVKKLFTKRNVQTVAFRLDDEEGEFYIALTRYVEDQSIKASQDDSARGRAIGFTMAMLQRRFASSTYAVRRSLERMRDKRQQILDDPESYRQEKINNKLPDDFDELTEHEQDQILEDLEKVVASVNPQNLRDEIQSLTELIDRAQLLEEREVESKLAKLKKTIIEAGVFADPKMKLLIFTEHKDTLDYLVSKLRSWGLSATQIHGGMKIGDRDTQGTRIYAEREFKEECQIMVATEAAGEGINLQFCWFMINYDIPWNPVRLEQRMGRIHRYGQTKDCLIYNFVSTNTREGRVLDKLFTKLLAIREELESDSVFDVIGEIFPSNRLEKMFREMYARNTDEQTIQDRIVADVDVEKVRRITESALEGLAKRELNLSAIIGKTEEAKERRLVPEVIEDFFVAAAPLAGVVPRETRAGSHIYRLGKLPRSLWTLGAELEPRFGKLGNDYKQIIFNQKLIEKDATNEWVTPGHPLFETVREKVGRETETDLQRGAVFYDLNVHAPYRLDVFAAIVRDGCGRELQKRLFVMQTDTESGEVVLKQPTLFLDLVPSPKGTPAPQFDNLSDRHATERILVEKSLRPVLEEVSAERKKQTDTILRHLEITSEELIARLNKRAGDLEDERDSGVESSVWAANMKQVEDRLDELHERFRSRVTELERESQCSIGGVHFIGSCWVVPHPERDQPSIAPMVRDEEIERIAVEFASAEAMKDGWTVESVESENRGFDLILRKYVEKNSVAVRFVEVKGRAGIGEVALSSNEYKTAERLQDDYWLYVVYNCANQPALHKIQNPARLGWQAVLKVEQYRLNSANILLAESETEG